MKLTFTSSRIIACIFMLHFLPGINSLMAQCVNADFSNGNFSGWTGTYSAGQCTGPIFTGVCTGCGTIDPFHAAGFNQGPDNSPPDAATQYNQIITTLAGGKDPNLLAQSDTLPMVYPGGSGYAARLGSMFQTITQSGMGDGETMTYSFVVNDPNNSFIYHYAVVLNDGGHLTGEQPYFHVSAVTGTGDSIPYASLQIDATTAPAIGGFNQYQSANGPAFWKPWSTVAIPLGNYVGQTVKITFTTRGCTPSGCAGSHYAYAYISAECGRFNIAVNSTSGCGALGTVLTAPAGNYRYSWIGPGITSSMDSSSIHIDLAGHYVLTMISNTTPADTFVLDTIISSIANTTSANFSATTACTGTATVFTDLSQPAGSITAWHWYFDDGSNAIVHNPNHVFPGAGVYAVKLIVTAAICTDSITSNVRVLPVPTATFNVRKPACANSPVTISYTGNGADTAIYNWNFNGGVANPGTGQGPQQVSWSSAGNKKVILSVAQGGCVSAPDTVLVNVNALPTVHSMPSQTVCINSPTSPYIFTGSIPGTIYKWTNNTPAIGLPASGSGTIRSFLGRNTGNTPLTANITVTPVTPGTGHAYIINYFSSTVSVVNTGTNTVTDSINVSQDPYGMALSPNDSLLYVVGSSRDSVHVISTVNNTIIHSIRVGNYPQCAVVSPDGSNLYVTNAADGSISFINTATYAITATAYTGGGSSGIAISPDGSKLYVTNNGNPGFVYVINTTTRAVIATIPVGIAPFGIVVTPDGLKAYVSSISSDSIAVINTLTNTVSKKILVGQNPDWLTVLPDGSKVYVCNYGSGTVSVINTVADTLMKNIPVGIQPHGISVSPQGNKIYVANWGSANAYAIDPYTDAVTDSVTVGSGPAGFGNFVTRGTDGCSGTPITFTITVEPAVAATVTGAATGCDSVSLSAHGGTVYTWSGGSHPDSATNTFTGSGIYTVTATTGNCSATAHQTVTVNPSPNAQINGPTSVCVGLQATLTASGGIAYTWSGGLGNTASITVQPVSTATYTVTVTNAHSCSATAQQTISLTNSPTATISGAVQVCNGDSILLTANGGNTYAWANRPDTTASILVSPTATTNYTVTATVGASCSATASQTVTVNQPVLNLLAQSICADTTYLFNNQHLAASGVYVDTLQTINGCDSVVRLVLNVNPLPQVSFTWDSLVASHSVFYNGFDHGLAVLCLNSFAVSLTLDGGSPAGGSYSGYAIFNNRIWLDSILSNPVIFPRLDTVAYTFVDSNGCRSIAFDSLVVTPCEGIHSISDDNAISVHPNPTNGKLYIQTQNLQAQSICIYDVEGRLMTTQPYTPELDVTHLSNGVYFMEVKANEVIARQRFVKM